MVLHKSLLITRKKLTKSKKKTGQPVQQGSCIGGVSCLGEKAKEGKRRLDRQCNPPTRLCFGAMGGLGLAPRAPLFFCGGWLVLSFCFLYFFLVCF